MNDRSLLAIFIAGNGLKEALGSNHFVFVDNLGVFGVGKASVRDGLCQAFESFDKRLKTLEPEVQSGNVTCLTNQLDCEVLASKEGSECALGVKRLPGRTWVVILGHCTFLGLQKRGCLSTSFTVYPFIRNYYYTGEPLVGQCM